jgi:hypothetical protein
MSEVTLMYPMHVCSLSYTPCTTYYSQVVRNLTTCLHSISDSYMYIRKTRHDELYDLNSTLNSLGT